MREQGVLVVKGSTEGSREHWRERNTGGKREYWRKEGVLKRVGSSGGSSRGKRKYWREEGVLEEGSGILEGVLEEVMEGVLEGVERGGGRGGPGKVYCLRRKKRVKRLIKINNQLSCTVYCTN